MKKVAYVFLCLFLFGFVACNHAAESGKQDLNNSQDSQESQELHVSQYSLKITNICDTDLSVSVGQINSEDESEKEIKTDSILKKTVIKPNQSIDISASLDDDSLFLVAASISGMASERVWSVETDYKMIVFNNINNSQKLLSMSKYINSCTATQRTIKLFNFSDRDVIYYIGDKPVDDYGAISEGNNYSVQEETKLKVNESAEVIAECYEKNKLILGYRDSQENKSSIHKISDDCDIIVILSNAYGIRIDEYKESEGKIKNTEEPGITSLKIHNHYEKAGIVAAGTISIKSDGSYDWNSIKPDKFLSTKILLPDESIIVYCKLSEQELFYISGAPLAGYYIYGSNDLKFPINTEDTENPVDVYLCKYFDYYQLSLYDIINLKEVSPDSSTIAYTIKNETDEILSVANYIKKESYIHAVSNRKNLYPQEEHTFFYDLSDFDADSSIGVYYSTEQSDNTDMKWEDKLDCISNSMICTLYKKDNGDIDAAKRFSLESTIQTYSFKVINLCADDITINVGTVPKVQNGYNWNYAESGSIKENIVVKANETITIYGKLCENYSFYITDNDGHEWSVDRENKRVVLNKNEIGTLYLKSYKDPHGKIQNTYESDLYPLTIKNDFGEPVFIGLGDVPVNGTSFNWNEENDYSFLDKTILMPDEKCTVYGKLPEGTAFFIQGWQVSGTGNYWGITKNYSKVTFVKTTDDEGNNKLGIEMSQY